ncbi:MAG: hypothetical protein ABI868_17250 [Acidobacteriota bacterium]
MAPTHITLSDDSLLAEYVELERFKGVLEQRIAIGPDLLAMLIKDGAIAEASAGAHFAIGGVWRTIKDAIGGRHAIRLLIADLKPFQLSTSATSLSRDNVPIACEFTVELQVNPEKPANVLGLTPAHGKLTKNGVLERLKPNLGERVLNATVRRVDALELRGNNGLQDKVQADTMQEVERVASDLGLIARSVSVAWGFNDEEKAAILKRQQERDQEALEREFKILTRTVERETETTVMRLEADLTIEKTKVSTEDDLRRLILSNELNFVDARETGIRIQEMKALEHELHLNRTQRLDGLKAQLEAEQHSIDMVRTGGLKREVEREIQLKDRRHDIDLDKVGGDRRDVAREIELKDRHHDVDLAKVGGERRDAELDLARRERIHTLEVTRINADVRFVERSIEELDRKQALALKKLEELQNLEIARAAQGDRLSTMKGLQDLEIGAERERLDLNIKGGDAEHRRRQEAAQLSAQTDLEKIRLLRDGTPEQILAINAGFTPAVANVLVEQARAKAAEGTDRLAIMREMIQQAQDGRVASEAQARHMFDSGMQGAQGVAQGVGAAVAGGRPTPAAPPADAAPAATECPGCHRTIPVTDRHCRYCGRQMRQ